MTAYYNEIDPFAAQWLRELIKQGHIADGVVDERSIEDVRPEELTAFSQCHFFAGIGVWSYALRQAGVPDDYRLWTGSAPCQPFSTAGKRKGSADERHLWPAFHRLIQACRPEIVMGEQVASGIATGSYKAQGIETLWQKDLALCHLMYGQEDREYYSVIRRMFLENRARITRKDGYSWLNAVQNDLEGLGYAFGSAVTAACAFGAPHQRKRLYWVGALDHTKDERYDNGIGGKPAGAGNEAPGAGQQEGHRRIAAEYPSESDGLANSHDTERKTRGSVASGSKTDGDAREGGSTCNSPSDGLADSSVQGPQGRLRGGQDSEWEIEHGHPGCGGTVDRPSPVAQPNNGGLEESRPEQQANGSGQYFEKASVVTGPTNGFWRDADWLWCRDGKWRPVEPGSFPLVDGAPSELVPSSDLSIKDVKSTKEAKNMRLKGYGNAIVAQPAQAFIEAVLGK